MFRGQFGPANQIHDFHPPITDAGLYWVVPVPAGGLTWGPDGRSATLAMRDVPVIDQPTWPATDARFIPARMTFRMTFEATDKPVTYEDKLKRFRVQGFLATCRMEAEVSVPSRGFAVIGEAVNGRHCDELAAK